jgi:hypothetical protein
VNKREVSATVIQLTHTEQVVLLVLEEREERKRVY